jgi:ABC-2 type transport system ATP-binding protein
MIHIDKVSYSINGKLILQDVEFLVETGECVALLGPNGAGKSTLMDMITGMLVPDSGAVSLWGQSFDSVRHRVGVQFDYTPVFDYLTIREVLQYFCAIHDMPFLKAEPMLKQLGLDKAYDNQGYMLSKGECKKFGIILAMLGHPELLILDEPTSDLDPFIREQCWKMFKQKQRSIFFSTHLWEEAEKYADRIAFITEGRICSVDTPRAFLSSKYLPSEHKVIVSKDSLPANQLDGEVFLEEDSSFHIFPSDISRFLDKIKEHTFNISILQKELKDVYLYLTKNE